MNIDELRKEIDKIDGKMLELFEERMALVNEISKIKKKGNINILDKNREEEILSLVDNISKEDLKKYNSELFKKILELSKEYQNEQ